MSSSRNSFLLPASPSPSLTPKKARHLRKEVAKLTLEQVSTDTGMPLSTVCRYELGELELRPDQVLAIERVLRLAIDARAKELQRVMATWPVARGDRASVGA
jgi:hypothetical protein